jgi:hypothetical protein
MPRIRLAIFRKDHPPALAIGQRLPGVRLVANVSLAKLDGWTGFDPAVIDTGAPVCLFPPAIWSRSEHHVLGRVRLGGISRRRQCRIPALLATVQCILSDGAQSLGPLRIRAYFAEQDNVPTLIGMHGFIERGTLHVELAKGRAFLTMT